MRVEVAPGTKVAIVAANVEQAARCALSLGLPQKAYVTLTDVNRARGLRLSAVFFADGWLLNPDAHELAAVVRACLRARGGSA